MHSRLKPDCSTNASANSLTNKPVTDTEWDMFLQSQLTLAWEFWSVC
jgi:hypothetical protein